ncbi:MAG TPA: DUF1844 domain-containing protein [Phycisphaerae bacterium]|nr:DUF1844 domain-containing protein [Phycisphaerae bacterium]
MPDDEGPRIHVDDDWKSEARREKEKLAAEAAKEPVGGPLGQPGFADLVNLLAMQAMVGLGGMQSQDGRAIPPNLPMAKYHIDLLEVLENKSASNLDDEEKKLLDTTLFNLRMAYVEITQAGAGPAPRPADDL